VVKTLIERKQPITQIKKAPLPNFSNLPQVGNQWHKSTFSPWVLRWRSTHLRPENRTMFGCWCRLRWSLQRPTVLRTGQRTAAARWLSLRQYSARTLACWRTCRAVRARTISDNVASTCRWRPEISRTSAHHCVLRIV